MLTAKHRLISGEQALLTAAVDLIVEGLPPDITGAGRVQHLGVLLCIIALDAAGEPVTAQAVCDFTSMHASHVTKIVNKLMEFGVLDREKILASHGRGHRYRYYPVMNFRHLIKKVTGKNQKNVGSEASP
jgi:purine nucleoside phosphorylase